MKQYKTVFFALALAGFVLIVSGCSRNGYGCNGRAKTITGEDVRKRNTR